MPAFLGQWCSQETSAANKEDLEDFVQWRRRQPGNAKAMVSAECEARMSRFIRLRRCVATRRLSESESDENQRGHFLWNPF